jgi:serine/threonine protein phosphatase PrpC
VNNSRREEKKVELIRNSLAKSAAGVNFDGEIKTNQDAYIAKRKVLGFDNFSIFSVFDGHGKYKLN